MSLTSFDDFNFIIAFILPGYLALAIYEKISISDTSEKEVDKIIWSIFFSTLLYTPYILLKEITTLEEAKTDVFLFSNFIMLLVYGIILGSISGIIIRHFFRKGIIEGKVWNSFFEKIPETGSWVAIFTKNGREYLGKIINSSKIEKKATHGSIILVEPKLVIRNSEGTVEFLHPLGKSILTTENEIESVVHVKE